MSLNLRILFGSFAFCALLVSSAAYGANETILKLSLSSTGADLAMDAAGVLGTVNDGIAATTGDQNTAIDYTGLLNGLYADVPSGASFSVAGLQRTGPSSIIGATVIVQDFFGGTFSLYDTAPGNNLLLRGTMTDSTLTGVIGGTGTGSIFTTRVGNFTAGSLLPNVVPNSLNISMALTNVNGGAGFSVSGFPFTLQPFNTDASVNISADTSPIPEPTSIAIALLGAMGFGFSRRRRT
jgi:PEP-CTERM motif-containing protein